MDPPRVRGTKDKEVSMKKLFVFMALAAFLVASAGADVYIKSKTHTDPMSMMGQNTPAKDDIVEQWLGDDVFSMKTGGTGSIVDLKKGVIYIINHNEKSYIESTLPLDFSKLLPAEMAAMAQGMMKMTVTVSPNGQTKTIGSWPCKGYDVTMQMMMMPMKMAVWATTEVPFDLNKYMEKTYGAQLAAQLRLDDAAIAEMKKIKGYWIASETTMEMMGAKIRTTSEVVEMTKKTPPAGVYTVPAGYKKQDKLSMKELQGR